MPKYFPENINYEKCESISAENCFIFCSYLAHVPQSCILKISKRRKTGMKNVKLRKRAEIRKSEVSNLLRLAINSNRTQHLSLNQWGKTNGAQNL